VALAAEVHFEVLEQARTSVAVVHVAHRRVEEVEVEEAEAQARPTLLQACFSNFAQAPFNEVEEQGPVHHEQELRPLLELVEGEVISPSPSTPKTMPLEKHFRDHRLRPLRWFETS
jgi:hypothetical protein